jgi:hypothetical protein
VIERPKLPPGDLLARLVAMLNEHLVRYQARQRGQPQPFDSSQTMCSSKALQRHDPEDYLATRIEVAVAPIRNLLHDSDVRFIRVLLKERLASDPSLSRLVARLTSPTRNR